MNVSVIIVLFQPSEDDLMYIKHLSQSCEGVVVDNSLKRNTEGDYLGSFYYIFNNGNKGIAEAQNIGIQYILQANNSDYIVFLDQDTRVDGDYVSKIVNAYLAVNMVQPNLAILGPTAINSRSDVEYRSIFHDPELINGIFFPQREIISSGSCVGVDVIRKVGLNLSWLFIDYVDFEWCWRANSMGYVCGITPNVTIHHSVGNREYYIGNYIIIISSPIRYFYQGRNYIKLVKLRYVPTQWKCTNFMKTILRILYLPFVPKGGWQCWKQLFRGLYVGLTKKI